MTLASDMEMRVADTQNIGTFVSDNRHPVNFFPCHPQLLHFGIQLLLDFFCCFLAIDGQVD